MKNLTVQDIITCTNGELIIGEKSGICNKFSKDTRTIQKGDMYIGIKGEKFDGNLFWKQALDNGAMGVIVQDIKFEAEDLDKYSDKVIIQVKDTLDCLYKIASYKRQLYDVPVVAITGSVGKTSTKDIVANVVSQKYNTVKTIGNNNNNIGLPFTILNAPTDIEAMVLEMGMNHFGEIHLLSEFTPASLQEARSIYPTPKTLPSSLKKVLRPSIPASVAGSAPISRRLISSVGRSQSCP